MVCQENRGVRRVLKGVCRRLVRGCNGAFSTAAMVLTFATFSANAWAAPEQETRVWQVNFQAAEKQAKESKMPLLIHFHASWCGPCRAMEADVLSTREVLTALKSGIVAVKVDSDQHPELVARFSISALPADVIVGVNGRVLSKTIGSSGRHAYLANLTKFKVVPESAPVNPVKQVIVQSKADLGKSATGNAANKSAEATNPPVSIPASAIVALNQNANATVTTGPTISPTGTSLESVKVEDKLVAPTPKPPVTLTKSLRREADRRIGLNGFSPVLLMESEKWKAGDAQFKHEFEGVCYLLTSSEELERFKTDPSKFVPALHGCDPVALLNDQIIQSGHIELKVTYKSKLYFFASKSTRDKFLSDPGKFANSYHLSFLSATSDKS